MTKTFAEGRKSKQKKVNFEVNQVPSCSTAGQNIGCGQNPVVKVEQPADLIVRRTSPRFQNSGSKPVVQPTIKKPPRAAKVPTKRPAVKNVVEQPPAHNKNKPPKLLKRDASTVSATRTITCTLSLDGMVKEEIVVPHLKHQPFSVAAYPTVIDDEFKIKKVPDWYYNPPRAVYECDICHWKMFQYRQFQVHAARSCPKRNRQELHELPMLSDRYFQNFGMMQNNLNINNSNLPSGSNSIVGGGAFGSLGLTPLFANNAVQQQQFFTPISGYDQRPFLPAVAPPSLLSLNPLNDMMNANIWNAPLHRQQPPFQPRQKLSKRQKRKIRHQKRDLKDALKRCDQNFEQLLNRLNPANDNINNANGPPLPGPSGLQQQAQPKNKKKNKKQKNKQQVQKQKMQVKNETKESDNNNINLKKMTKAERRAYNAIKALAKERSLNDVIKKAKTMKMNPSTQQPMKAVKTEPTV